MSRELRALRSADRRCYECGAGMCWRCTIEHDDEGKPCPVAWREDRSRNQDRAL